MPPLPASPSSEAFSISPLCCALFINGPRRCWAERWWLLEQDPGDGRQLCKRLAKYRSWLLADGCSIEWAALRLFAPPFWSWAAIDAPLQPLPIWQGPDNCDVGPLFGFRTGKKRWGNKLFRGVSDDEIHKAAWIREGLQIPGPPLAVITDPLAVTKDELWAFVVQFFRDNTAHLEKVDTTVTPKQYRLTSWTTAAFVDVRDRETHRGRWQRVSWEMPVWADSPPFSPCGMSVGVLWAPYESDARFYVNGAVEKVNYYKAKDTAQVFPLPIIWWGLGTDKEIYNGPLAGELSNPHHRLPNIFGLSWGNAPGDHYCGVASDFVGLAVRTWPVGAHTPPVLLCECDMPVPVPVRFRLSDNSVVQPDGRDIIFQVPAHSASIPGPNQFLIDLTCGCSDPCTSDCSYWTNDVPWSSPANAFALSWPPSGAFNFWVTVPSLTILKKGAMAVWVKCADPLDSADVNLVFAADPASTKLFEWGLRHGPTTFSMSLHMRQPNTDFAGNTNLLPSDQNYHLYSFSYDATVAGPANLTFYYDGVPLTTLAGSSVAAEADFTYPEVLLMSIGTVPSGFVFDDFRIFDFPLTAGDHLDLFNRNSTILPRNWYKMNEGQGVIVGDSGAVPTPGYIPKCLESGPPVACLPTGGLAYGGLIIHGKVASLGQPITSVGGGTF